MGAVATLILAGMNLTDRIYLVVHIALTGLVLVRWNAVPHAAWYLAWNAFALIAILFASRKQHDNAVWEFLHDWLPVIFFISVFEEVSFLSLALRGHWQDSHLIALESAIFATSPAEWLHHHMNPWLAELLEFGYFTFYLLYPVVAGILWAWRRRPAFAGAFRRLTDSLSVGYLLCYATYLLFPTRSPSHHVGLVPSLTPQAGGPFHFLVRTIQGHAGVHGNAFPSSHIMLAFVVLVFAFRYVPRLAFPLLICVLLMCVGAVYDGYHYAIDVLAGALVGIALGVAAVRSSSNRNPEQSVS